jgi:putative Holliday junction resolvase
LKVLAIDFGLRRVGVAVGDTELGIAVPAGVLPNNGKLIEKIAEIVREKGVEKVVVGLPLTPSGREGERAKAVREFISKLRATLPNLPVETWDERYTTQEAERRLSHLRPSRRKNLLDAVSAQVILEEYLSRFKSRQG